MRVCHGRHDAVIADFEYWAMMECSCSFKVLTKQDHPVVMTAKRRYTLEGTPQATTNCPAAPLYLWRYRLLTDIHDSVVTSGR